MRGARRASRAAAAGAGTGQGDSGVEQPEQVAESSSTASPRVESILGAAARVFSEKGFAATTMREVAKESGASLGSIYHHFESKEEILRAIMVQNFQRVSQSLEEKLRLVTEPRRALELFVENHVAFFARHLDEMRVMSHELDTLGGTAGEEVAELRRAYTATLRDTLARLRPDLSSGDLRIATLCLFGMLNWTYRWFHTLPTEVDPARLGRRMAALFLDGFLDATPVG